MANQEDKKTQKNEKQSKVLTIFLTTFLVTFALVLLMVKNLPEIDVEIDKNTEETQSEDADKGSVDERLRWIQFEDNMPGVSTRFTGADESQDTANQQNEENIIEYDDDTPEKTKTNKSTTREEAVIKVEKIQNHNEQNTPPATPAPVVNKISKVYVGQFATIEQAISIQNKLSDAGLDLAPFVKKVGSYYVVQIGSYASAQKAQSVAESVQNAGFSARVVSE